MAPKTPPNVSDAIKSLSVTDQVIVQTYIAKLKAIIDDLETQVLQLKDGDPHAHYHGHEKCTSDHDHTSHDHNVSDEKMSASKGHDHDHGHGHEHGHKHEHEHGHGHSHSKNTDDEELPATVDRNQSSFEEEFDAELDVSAVEDDLPPMYNGDGSNDDFDKATDAKIVASDLKAEGKYGDALNKFSEAILAAEPSALLLANRAHCLFKLERYPAAIRDCDAALERNPDSAKALRIRGECHLELMHYHAALKDLSAAQTIDFDEEAADMLKRATDKCKEIDSEKVKKKVEEEEKIRKRAEEVKKAQENAKKEAEDAARERSRGAGGAGMPGMGMGGMAGMQGMMAGLMSDPEIALGMQNPKIQKAFQDLMSGPGGPMSLMSNPTKLQELMADPEVGPFLQKFMGKVMGGAGGMGMGGGSAGGNNRNEDDLPDLGDDDMPDIVD